MLQDKIKRKLFLFFLFWNFVSFTSTVLRRIIVKAETNWYYQPFYSSVLESKYFSNSWIIWKGEVVGACRSTGLPFLSTMNLVKFHLIASIKVPPCSFFKYSYKGWASLPFTSIFSNKSNLTLLSLMKHWISSAFPGSWCPNWLQGNARILRPKIMK